MAQLSGTMPNKDDSPYRWHFWKGTVLTILCRYYCFPQLLPEKLHVTKFCCVILSLLFAWLFSLNIQHALVVLTPFYFFSFSFSFVVFFKRLFIFRLLLTSYRLYIHGKQDQKRYFRNSGFWPNAIFGFEPIAHEIGLYLDVLDISFTWQPLLCVIHSPFSLGLIPSASLDLSVHLISKHEKISGQSACVLFLPFSIDTMNEHNNALPNVYTLRMSSFQFSMKLNHLYGWIGIFTDDVKLQSLLRVRCRINEETTIIWKRFGVVFVCCYLRHYHCHIICPPIIAIILSKHVFLSSLRNNVSSSAAKHSVKSVA